MIIYDDFFEDVLLDPIKEGANNLKIISGYASSAMAFHHLEKMKNLTNSHINISLVVGMCPIDGVSLSDHQGFKKIQNDDYENHFKCNYIHELPQVHSKIYLWSKNNDFFKSFIGSANYTQNAFYGKQQEILEVSQDMSALEYFNQLEKRSIVCDHNEIESFVKIYNRNNLSNDITQTNNSMDLGSSLEEVSIPLFSITNGSKVIPERSGLNWGQRPELKRDPNQAYIQLRPDVYRSDFFPLRSQHFTVLTDDGYTLICTRAQKSKEGQAIQTPHNNSLLGEYFRKRLGVSSGDKVNFSHLDSYGRDNVTFYKIDSENYYMDFSV